MDFLQNPEFANRFCSACIAGERGPVLPITAAAMATPGPAQPAAAAADSAPAKNKLSKQYFAELSFKGAGLSLAGSAVYAGATHIGDMYELSGKLWNLYLTGERGISGFCGPTMRAAALHLYKIHLQREAGVPAYKWGEFK